MTETHPTSAWIEVTAGRDRALVCSAGGVTMTFALGPATGAAKEPARLAALLGGGLVSLRHCEQIHGRTIYQVHAGGEDVIEVGPGDGLMTTEPGVGLLVWTADCVPVLLAGDGIVAAIHAGWRGCAADIVGAAVESMKHERGCSPDRLHVALGPSVCGACYEVGTEVAAALRSLDLDETRWRNGNRVDLREFLTARLEQIGVPCDQIACVGGCTAESRELASYRRDGDHAGRQWAMIHLNH